MAASPWRLDPFASAIDLDRGEQVATHRLAGTGTRFLAGLIDLTVRMPAFLLAGFLIVRQGDQLTWTQRVCGATAALFAIEFIYFFLFEVFTRGQTPGKNACTCRVVRASGGVATISQLFIRNVLRVIDFLPAFYILGGAVAWSGGRQQRIGDRIAGTVVVFDDSLREMLRSDVVPESVYSTSVDAYLLESVLLRGHFFREEVQEPLVRQLASYFFRKYGADSEIGRIYLSGDLESFLRELYRSEKQASEGE